MKKRRCIVLLAFVSLLVFGTLPLEQVSATEIYWQDDFNDNNLDGWTKHQAEYPQYTVDFIAENEAVYAHKDNWAAWGWLSYPSNVSVGHWSFDFYQPPDEDGPCDFFFMANSTQWNSIEAYSIHIHCQADSPVSIALVHWNGSFQDSWIHSSLKTYFHDSKINGTWVDFDVTRNSLGDIKVYLDQDPEPIIQVSETSFDDSEFFMFSVGQYHTDRWTGFGTDNVVVDDEADWTPPPETTTPTTPPDTPPDTTPTTGNGEPLDMTMIMIVAGGGVAVVVIVAIVVKIRSS